MAIAIGYSREGLPTAFRMIDLREVSLMDVIQYFREVIVSDFNIINATLSDDTDQ